MHTRAHPTYVYTKALTGGYIPILTCSHDLKSCSNYRNTTENSNISTTFTNYINIFYILIHTFTYACFMCTQVCIVHKQIKQKSFSINKYNTKIADFLLPSPNLLKYNHNWKNVTWIKLLPNFWILFEFYYFPNDVSSWQVPPRPLT